MENKRERNGAFAPSQADRKADGVASAKPTVITGSEDATVNRTPPGKKPQKDWDVGFDDEQPDRS
jgi:hypothetical protein